MKTCRNMEMRWAPELGWMWCGEEKTPDLSRYRIPVVRSVAIHFTELSGLSFAFGKE
jgi:hypothetical protein